MARFNRILLIILFFFSIVMIISGCSKKTYIYNQSDNTNNNFVEANASEKESVFDNIGEIPLMTFTSLEEYCSFFNEKNLENIILSDRQLDMLGTFEKMVVTSGGYNGDYSQLFYTIESSEQIYNLTITDTSIRKNNSELKKLDVSLTNNDLRTIESKESGLVVYNDVELCYIGGDLLWISWKADNIEYKITSSKMLSYYPLELDNFVSHLLKKDETLNMIGSFMD